LKYTIGIDSCKYGWIVTAFPIKGNELLWLRIVKNLSELHTLIKNSVATFIDIPIALSDSLEDRQCDVIARKLLKKRASSVFKAPHIGSLSCKNYFEAKKCNLSATDKSMPIQTWNIIPKIIETRNLILKDATLKEVIKESHPELAFMHLNGMVNLSYSKHSKKGIAERINILNKHIEKSKLCSLIENLNSKRLLPDLLDSLSLSIVSSKFYNNYITIPEDSIFDITGLLMQITF